MEMNEGVVPAFRVTRGPSGLCIRVPVKSDKVRTLLNLVWFLVWAGGEVACAIFILGGVRPRELDSSVSLRLADLFFAAFTVAGGLVLWRLLWGVGGSEVFLPGPDALRVKRGIGRIAHTRTFPYERITSLRASRLKYRVIYPSWGRAFIGHEDSEISIESGGRTYGYGKGLGQSEAMDLVNLLEEEIRLLLPKPPRSRAPSTSHR